MESMKLAKAPEVARSDMETERIDDFRSVVERYQSLVWAIAYSITGDSSLSEDVAQETFLAAWNQQADIRDLSKLKPYLATIARNLARKAIRGTGREVSETDAIVEAEDVDTRGPLDEVLKREELSQVNVALGQMPMSSREAFVLFYAEGQSVARVADQLELSPSAVKQRLYRARESLKESLETTLSHSITTGVPGKAFAAATMTLILSQSTAAAASVASVQASETLATPTSPFAISGKLVAGAVLVAVSAVALLVFIAQSETSNDEEREVSRTAIKESNQPGPSPQDPTLLSPRPAGQLQAAEIQSADKAQAAIAQDLLSTRILENWADADIDGDGQLSEDEILVLRDTQEDELTKQILKYWQNNHCGGGSDVHPAIGVTCAFVGHSEDGQAQEGWIPYNLYGLRARFEEELESGHAMDAQQWVASKVATAQKERICYEITASHHDLVHKLRGDTQEPLPWVASVTFRDEEPLRFPPPKKLKVELTNVADEFEAKKVAKRWGVQLLVLGTDEHHIAITEAFIAELATLPAAIRDAMEAE